MRGGVRVETGTALDGVEVQAVCKFLLRLHSLQAWDRARVYWQWSRLKQANARCAPRGFIMTTRHHSPLRIWLGRWSLVALASTLAISASAAQAHPVLDGPKQPASPQAEAGDPAVSEMRWRLRHGRELSGTAGILRSETPLALPQGRSISLDGIRFEWPAGIPRSFKDYRAGNVLDGLLVLKDGRIAFEQYYDGFGLRDTHNWASVSKSVVGVVAERLARSGKIDLDAQVLSLIHI